MKYDLEKILPHNHPMILIDDIKEINIDDGEILIRPIKGLFNDDN